MNETIELELALPQSTYLALKHAAEEQNKTEAEIAAQAIEAFFQPQVPVNSVIGLFADEAELMDQITQEIMLRRETTPLRMTSH